MAGRKREWLRRKMKVMTTKHERWASRRVGVLSSMWRRWRQQHRHPDLHLLVLLDGILYYLLWVVEAITIAASLCFFFLRFGFRV